MRLILASVLRLLKRYRLVPRSGSYLPKHGLLPIVAVLPVVVYAYAVQAVVTSRSEDHERDVVRRNTSALSARLERRLDTDLAICRDYAHWDDIYDQIRHADPEWIRTNLELGVGTSFGFSIAVLWDRGGEAVWAKGVDGAMLRELADLRVLERSLKGEPVKGLISLDGRAYTCAAVSIHTSSHGGEARGVLIVARLMDRQFVDTLAAGADSRTAFIYSSGHITFPENLGRLETVPQPLVDLMAGGAPIEAPAVMESTDGATSYGVLPILDINGARIGVLVNASSRARLMQNLSTIRQMSIALMLLCVVIGAAGTSYFRNRALAIRAQRDELTGLYNHGYLQECLMNQVQVAERYERPLAVLLLDIDHFKVVNDIHGHHAGDMVLRAVAETLGETVREVDVVARYGGEEFVVVMPETETAQALAAGERLRAAIEDRAVHIRSAVSGPPGPVYLQVTASIGVAAFPGDGLSPTELLAAADSGLGAAKRTRNRVFAFGEIVSDSPATCRRRAALEGFLRDSSISAVRPLVAAIDTRDPGAANHSEKTAEYAVAIGGELGLSTHDLGLACKAALLHDVGMMGIPDHLVTKVGSLSDEEMDVMREHCRLGADILLQSPQLAAAARAVLCHHERYDGQGYPSGLAGGEIPLIARVIAVADVLDALMSPRAYREPLSPVGAMEEVRAQAGGQFDPDVVDAAARAMAQLFGQGARRAA